MGLHNFCGISVKRNDFRFLSRVDLVQAMSVAIMTVDYKESSTTAASAANIH